MTRTQFKGLDTLLFINVKLKLMPIWQQIEPYGFGILSFKNLT